MSEFLRKPRNFLVVLVLIYIPMVYYGTMSEDGFADEYFYYCKARAVTEGYVPYRDFFSSQMPLLIYPLALLFRIFGPSVAVGKLVPLSSSFAIIFLTYLTGERIVRNSGILAAFLILFTSAYFHSVSHTMIGIMSVMVPMMLAYYCHLTGRTFLSGLFSVVAVFTRLNALPMSFLLFFLNRREKRFYMGVAASFPLFLFFLVPNFLEDAILYQFVKSPQQGITKLAAAWNFIVFSKGFMLFPIIGILFLLGKDRVYRDVGGWFRKGNDKLDLIAFPLAYVLLAFFSQKSTYVYYFVPIMPFLAIMGGIGLLELSRSKYRFPAFAGILLAISAVNFGPACITSQYVSRAPPVLDELSAYIRENTNENETVLFLSHPGTYVSLKADRDLAGNFIQYSYQWYYVYGDVADDRLSEIIVNEKPRFVGILASEFHAYREMNVSLDRTFGLIKSNYRPVEVYYNELGGRLMVIVLWAAGDMFDGTDEFGEPEGNGTRYYFERLKFSAGDNTTTMDGIEEIDDVHDSGPYIPGALLRNESQTGLVARNPLEWPLHGLSYYNVSEDNLTSEAWVSSVDDGIIRLIIYSYFDGEIISVTRILYDYNAGQVGEVKIFSRASEEVTKDFYLTFQQVSVTERMYGLLDEAIKKQASGEIDQYEYMMMVNDILANRNV